MKINTAEPKYCIIDETMKEPNIEAIIPKIEGGESFKEEWFRALYKGVSLIPQNGDGIRLCLAISTVLEDPDIDWDRFGASKFTHEQIVFLGNAMVAQHKHKGINRNLSNIEPGRIEGLFQVYVAMTVGMLETYIDTIPSVTVTNLRSTLKEFFRDPKNTDKINELKKILISIKNSLNKPAILELTAKYRSRLKHREVGEDTWNKYFRADFINILKSEMLGPFDGKLPKEIDSLFTIDD